MKKEWLIRIRKAKNLTQDKVATLAFIERSYYSQIESGKRNPSLNVACSIASVLEFDPLYFFQNESSPIINGIPNQISEFFISVDKGFVLYPYESHDKYIEHAAAFLLTSVSKKRDSLLIDSTQNLLLIKSQLPKGRKFTRYIHFCDNGDYELDLMSVLDEYINSQKTTNLWINLETPSTVGFLNKETYQEAIDKKDLLLINAYNGDHVSAKLHIEMMRSFPYLMTDSEVVYSPLTNQEKRKIYPTLYKF